MKLKNPSDVLKMASAIERHVNNLLVTMAIAEQKREEVEAIQRSVLAENVYEYDAERWARLEVSGRITDPDECHLMRDDHAQDYYSKLNAIHLANGFEDAAKGYCPALCAESLIVKAKNILMDAAQEFTGFERAKIWKSEHRRKYLDLLIGAVVNRPGYKKPDLRSYAA